MTSTNPRDDDVTTLTLVLFERFFSQVVVGQRAIFQNQYEFNGTPSIGELLDGTIKLSFWLNVRVCVKEKESVCVDVFQWFFAVLILLWTIGVAMAVVFRMALHIG